MPSNERRCAYRTIFHFMALTLALLRFAQCDAQSQSGSLSASQAQTVEQLLRLDSQAALDKLRERAGSSAVGAPPSNRSPAPTASGLGADSDSWQVLSILGAAGQQRVDLTHNQKVIRGAALGDIVDRWRITRIQGGCLGLSRVVDQASNAANTGGTGSGRKVNKRPNPGTVPPAQPTQTHCFVDDRRGVQPRSEAIPLGSLPPPMPTPMSSTGFIPSNP